MKWTVMISKSYITLRFEFATLDDLHAFLEVFFAGLDEPKSVKVELECVKESESVEEDE